MVSSRLLLGALVSDPAAGWLLMATAAVPLYIDGFMRGTRCTGTGVNPRAAIALLHKYHKA